MTRTTLTAAAVAAAIAGSGYHDRAWAAGLAIAARHKQNARKAKKGGAR